MDWVRLIATAGDGARWLLLPLLEGADEECPGSIAGAGISRTRESCQTKKNHFDVVVVVVVVVTV